MSQDEAELKAEQETSDVNAFLERSDIKEKSSKLAASKEKLATISEKIAKLEEKNPQLALKFANGEQAVQAEATAPKTSDLLDLFEYSRLRSEQSDTLHDIWETVASVTEYAEAFQTDHPNFAKYKDVILENAGRIITMAAMYTAAGRGVKAIVGVGASILAQNEVFAAIVENGTEALVDNAASQGRTEAESVRFSKAALTTVEYLTDGMAAIGLVKALKNVPAIKAKCISMKGSVAERAKGVFQRTQATKAKFDALSVQAIAETSSNVPSLETEIRKQAAIDFAKLQAEPRGKGRIDWNEVDLQKRGLDYEAKIAMEEFGDCTRTPVNAEAFDAFRFSDGHAVSIKSLDTQTLSRLRDPRGITNTIYKYINDIVNFKEIKRGKFSVTPEMINSRELFIGVPSTTSFEQFLTIQKAANRAELNGIKFTLRFEDGK